MKIEYRLTSIYTQSIDWSRHLLDYGKMKSQGVNVRLMLDLGHVTIPWSEIKWNSRLSI